MIYNDHPGPWQVFLKRKDIIGLTPHEARKQYLIEQEGFNTGIASAQATAVAAAAQSGNTSDGGLVREKRIAAKKGYALPKGNLQKARRTPPPPRQLPGSARVPVPSSYEVFNYGVPNQLSSSADPAVPTFELLLERGSPSNFSYGYLVWDSNNYVWSLSNVNQEPTHQHFIYEEDLDGGEILPKYIGGTTGNAWGIYTNIDGSGETIQVSPGFNSAFSTIYIDAMGEDYNDDNKFYKLYPLPISVNGAPVYYSGLSGNLYIYANVVDRDDNLGNGADVPTGLGWQLCAPGNSFWTSINNFEATVEDLSPAFSGSGFASTDINDPIGSGVGDNLSMGTPNFIFTYDQSSSYDFTGTTIETAQLWQGGFDPNLHASFQPPSDLLAGYYDYANLVNGRPSWQGRTSTDVEDYKIHWDNTSWVISSASIVYVTGDTEPFSPDGVMSGVLGPSTPYSGLSIGLDVTYTTS